MAAAAAAQKMATVKLSNGNTMPQVASGCAFGTWSGGDGFQGFLPELAWRSTQMAVDAGIRSFDGAFAYGTQRQVGDVLGKKFADGSLTRDELFLTTKLGHPAAPPHLSMSHRRTWNPRDVAPTASPENMENIKKVIRDHMDQSIDEIGCGYFDLVLMHWPGAFHETDKEYAAAVRAAMWEQFEVFYKIGNAKAIGVSNFTLGHLEELMKTAVVKPQVNQIELHPYCQDKALVDYCKSQDIVVEAYAPFASGMFGLLTDPVIAAVAKRLDRNAGQVILRWHVQQGHVVLPKSTKAEHIKKNSELFDFELSAEDMAAISALQKEGEEARRTCPDPASIL
jgi:diketogulonate reductase-like aldo/keto reductase